MTHPGHLISLPQIDPPLILSHHPWFLGPGECDMIQDTQDRRAIPLSLLQCILLWLYALKP